MPNDSKRYAMVCSRCGSDDVSRDAWADWDTGKQMWVLRCAFDTAHCHKCDGETSITEVELAPASS
jgi:alpha-D-ribose 1-methylphosphonate 5-phosphate C-P lyase